MEKQNKRVEETRKKLLMPIRMGGVGLICLGLYVFAMNADPVIGSIVLIVGFIDVILAQRFVELIIPDNIKFTDEPKND